MKKILFLEFSKGDVGFFLGATTSHVGPSCFPTKRVTVSAFGDFGSKMLDQGSILVSYNSGKIKTTTVSTLSAGQDDQFECRTILKLPSTNS